MNTSKVTRVTIVDHSRRTKETDEKGRIFERWWDDGASANLELQDGGKTLKIFIGDKK